MLRVNSWHELDNLEKLVSMDLIQKARIRWDVEGDENSKFFHGIINSKRKSQSDPQVLVSTWRKWIMAGLKSSRVPSSSMKSLTIGVIFKMEDRRPRRSIGSFLIYHSYGRTSIALKDDVTGNLFTRLFRLEKNQNCLVRDRIVNGLLWAWIGRRLDCASPSLYTDGFIILSHSLLPLHLVVWILIQYYVPYVPSTLSPIPMPFSLVVQLPIFGGLFVVGCLVELKIPKLSSLLMIETYGTLVGKLQKSRKTELMSFSPPLVGCFGVLGITTFSILKT
ncbi:hypothetical protein Tco_1244899 [Tanacetum coccineum]